MPAQTFPPATGIPEDAPESFVLLDRITAYTPQALEAVCHFTGAGQWQGLEAAAQAAAMHQRLHVNFSKHAFLLGVRRFPLGDTLLTGTFSVLAELLGQAGQSALYRVRIQGPDKEGGNTCPSKSIPTLSAVCLEGELTIGLIPYNDDFREADIAPYYRRRAQWLLR